jgi:SNF2 family DNA or RNA helicase
MCGVKLHLKTKPVTVYKLVTEGTVDARILEIGTKKTEVNSTVLDSSASDKEEGQTMSSLLKEALRSFLS